MQRRQLVSGFHFHIFDLKDYRDGLIFVGAIYETVSVPYLTVLGSLKKSPL